MKSFRNAVLQLPVLARDSRNPDVTSPAGLPQGTRFNQTGRPAPGVRHVVHDDRHPEGDPQGHARGEDQRHRSGGHRRRDPHLPARQGRTPDRVADRHDADLDPADDDPEVRREVPTGSADSGSAATAGNQFSLAPITLATDEADPLERLRRIVASTSHVKESGAYPVRSLMAMTEEALGGLVGNGPAHRGAGAEPDGSNAGGAHAGEQRPGAASRRCTSAAPRWST